jgi:hypothetical protein
VNYGKFDAALAAALAGRADADAVAEGSGLAVFVQLADGVTPAEREGLAALGLGAAAGGEDLTCTATLTIAQVATLSDQVSVRRMQLSGRLRLRA